MALRESLAAISPPWLQAFWSSRVQYVNAIGLDGVAEWMRNGVKASFPGYAPPDALGFIGRDRNLDRGPTETDTAFASRLSGAFDTWATAGSPVTLLRQLAVFFTPSTATPIRLVSNSATWHTIDLTTFAVTKTQAANWTWDSFASTRWFRGWVIVDSSIGPWAVDVWSPSVGLWGDGGTWGSNATIADIAYLQTIVAKWKPANITAMNIIVTFSSTILRPTDTAPPNPNGTSDTPLWRTGVNAIFWGNN